jgi:prepilin-type N-terminal cleavage/methylation domain-containing protein
MRTILALPSINRSAGFTVAELLIALIIVGILAGLVLFSVQGTQTTSRDSERTTDLETIHGKLEEYFEDKGGYPDSISVSLLNGIDPAAMIDPRGNSITNESPASDQVAAMALAAPTDSGSNYQYIPYPAGCNAITCTGYVLKSYIEKPTPKVHNPYIRTGLHNN